MPLTEPWSKRHKKVTHHGGLPFNLSNSFANPISQPELVKLSLERGDSEIVQDYNNHGLDYTPNGGSLDLREEIANMYGPSITSDNVLVFAGK